MSYRPEEQSLEPSIKEILSGIEKFNNAVKERINESAWSKEHIEYLNKIRRELFDIQVKLENLNRETW